MLEREHPHIPIQYCQFHQIQTVKKYIPRHAHTEAARCLRKIALRLSSSDHIRFTTAFSVWHVLFQSFIDEKTIHDDLKRKRKWRYTHQRLRSAYHSLKGNLPYLHTTELHPLLKIPNTTNECDGFFAHLKERIKRHRGLSGKRKWKMIHYLLENWE